MKHRQLVRLLAQHRSLPIDAARRAVDALLRAMVAALARGERVDVRRFGAFFVRPLAARQNVLPHSDAPQALPARRAPAFRASAEWVARLNAPRPVPVLAPPASDSAQT